MKTMEKTEESNNTSLIAKDISYIQKDMSEIKASIKELSGVYSTKIYVDDVNRAIDDRLSRLEKSSNLWKWLSPTLAAVLGSVLTFLIISYLTNLA